MKPNPSYPKHRAKLTLAACLATLFAVSSAFAQSNAAGTGAPPAKDAALQTDQEVQVLSPFQVTSDKDYGYLKTNAATATRIGAEIQKVPLSISVISQEFMQDTDLRSTNDIYKYMASASGDSQFEATRPSNAPTPQGHNTLRGFPVNVILRNGVFMYSVKSVTDVVDRIEVIKGPASVFFGQGYPGGVINYITKKAQFAKIPTTIRYTVGDNKQNHVVLDLNQVLSDKAALRIVAGWENSKGAQTLSYTKRFNMDTSMVFRPFDNDKLVLTAEINYLNEHYNSANQFSWIFPDQYFQDYNNPSAALIAAAKVTTADQFRNLINTNLGAWANYKRIADGNPTMPIYTSNKRGGYYTDRSGNYIHDEAFSFQNRGSYINNEATVSEFTAEFKPLSWLDGRYVYTRDNTQFYDREGYWYPNADQWHYRLTGGGGSGYFRKTDTHQADFVFHFDTNVFTPLKHKLLAGYLFDKSLQQYWAPTGVTYVNVPGYNVGGTDASNGVVAGNLGNVPPTQVIRDRSGNVKSVTDVYNLWDPGFEIQPEAGDKIYPINRNNLDGYEGQNNAWYVNYQLTALDDRLTTLAGFRRETSRSGGQVGTVNFPWYAPPAYAFADSITYPPAAYNITYSYASTQFGSQTGDSWMAGMSYEIKKDLNVYFSVSKTFRYNGTGELGSYTAYLGNFSGVDNQAKLTDMFTKTLAAYASIGRPLVYKFADGSTRTLNTVADCFQAIDDAGANRISQNETGMNREIGVKSSLWDGKLTATVSVFQADRQNQKKEDSYHQSLDVFNFNSNPIVDPNTGVNVSPDKDRHFRWYSNDSHDRTQGAEFEAIWTPIRNFQSYISGSWIWSAKTVANPTIQPGNILYDIYFGSRLESTPEYTLKTFNKYTFTDGPVRGLGLGLGVRYASEIVLGRDLSWNPKNGGYTAGDYVVFDMTVSYPYEILGYKLKSQLGIYNVTDKVYSDGWYVLAPARYWTLTTTLTF